MKSLNTGEFIIDCSGRRFSAFNGIIGINDDMQVTEGSYDGFLYPGRVQNLPLSDVTDLERAELADYMIGLWNKWKAI
jgi:hypothetical protein